MKRWGQVSNNLSISEHLYKIISLLEEYRSYWDLEIIYEYPNFKTGFRESWVSYLNTLSIDDLFYLQKYHLEGSVPVGLSDLIKSIQTLKEVRIERAFREELPTMAYQFMTEKKRHEINQVVGLLEGEELLARDERILDFCGGAGYLGRTLSHYYGSRVRSVDFDHSLQRRGEERLSCLGPGSREGEIEFLCCDVLKDCDYLSRNIDGLDGLVGIHTCAHLSDVQIELFKKFKAKWFLNVSCCYYKTKDPFYSFSKLTKTQNFNLSKESLLLAARGEDLDLESFRFAMHVKYFRYMLHLYMVDVLGQGFVAMGGLRKAEYKLEFSEYAQRQLLSVLELEVSREELSSFERDGSNRQKVGEMIACNTFRVLFSRLVELYITLDRACSLEEEGYGVDVFQIFDSKVSPRNLAIFATNL